LTDTTTVAIAAARPAAGLSGPGTETPATGQMATVATAAVNFAVAGTAPIDLGSAPGAASLDVQSGGFSGDTVTAAAVADGCDTVSLSTETCALAGSMDDLSTDAVVYSQLGTSTIIP
jgi:hypothetical protein